MSIRGHEGSRTVNVQQAPPQFKTPKNHKGLTLDYFKNILLQKEIENLAEKQLFFRHWK